MEDSAIIATCKSQTDSVSLDQCCVDVAYFQNGEYKDFRIEWYPQGQARRVYQAVVDKYPPGQPQVLVTLRRGDKHRSIIASYINFKSDDNKIRGKHRTAKGR